ncbi:MAG: hypothetical protein A3I29_03155 [Candidatus Magasanikbacteria bacterium RIFCSPLOWO2_02_FULL_44_11]|uniref:Uncharacterized protein n=1 Tax=Candidatus Magasanikbacteria bacterium RIFCSPLOWO2_02_FULL_44_11 TaxID=1798689 RepID=A0A1F6NC42_9BACT|nr:MAG: hypothetical protein A3I29_03155 [Candidatus Magasanikbacteria bacterium RIFCSPLOWO2_02_FULL_44_11]
MKKANEDSPEDLRAVAREINLSREEKQAIWQVLETQISPPQSVPVVFPDKPSPASPTIAS